MISNATVMSAATLLFCGMIMIWSGLIISGTLIQAGLKAVAEAIKEVEERR